MNRLNPSSLRMNIDRLRRMRFNVIERAPEFGVTFESEWKLWINSRDYSALLSDPRFTDFFRVDFSRNETVFYGLTVEPTHRVEPGVVFALYRDSLRYAMLVADFADDRAPMVVETSYGYTSGDPRAAMQLAARVPNDYTATIRAPETNATDLGALSTGLILRANLESMRRVADMFHEATQGTDTRRDGGKPTPRTIQRQPTGRKFDL